MSSCHYNIFINVNIIPENGHKNQLLHSFDSEIHWLQTQKLHPHVNQQNLILQPTTQIASIWHLFSSFFWQRIPNLFGNVNITKSYWVEFIEWNFMLPCMLCQNSWVHDRKFYKQSFIVYDFLLFCYQLSFCQGMMYFWQWLLWCVVPTKTLH